MRSVLPRHKGILAFFSLPISALLVLSLLLALSACSKKTTPTTGTTPKPTQTAASRTTTWPSERLIKQPITATAVAAQAVTLGSVATQGVEIVIPPGTLSDGTVVTITNPENPPAVASSIGKPVSAPVQISTGDSANEDTTTRLDQLVTVTLKFDRTRLSSGSDPTTIWAAFYDPASKQWEPFQPDAVDMSAGTVTFSMGHLTNVTALDIPLGVYTEKIVRNKAVADVLNEKVGKPVIDKLAEKGLEHVLKDGLGLKEEATKYKVYSSFINDDEWGEITAKGATVVAAGKDASADEVVDLAQTVNVFIGKKMVENIPEGQLADALTKLSPDKWAEYSDEGASQGYENAISWTKAGSEAAAYLVEKRYQDAARVIGEQIADGIPLVKAIRASAEVIDYGITVWKNAEIEAAYKAFKNGASITSGNSSFGFGSKFEVNKGSFDDVWNQMAAVDTWITGQAIKAEERARAEDDSRGPLPLSEAERASISEKAKADLKADFEERARKEGEIEKVQANLKDLLDRATALDMLGGASALRYSPDNLETRVKAVLTARAMIVRDTAGKVLKNQDGKIVTLTNQDIAELAKWYLTGTTQKEGRELYWKELNRRFKIDLAAAAAGKWVLVETSQVGQGTGIRGNGTATAIAKYEVFWEGAMQTYARSEWSCTWPQPPSTLIPGQTWAGTISVENMVSFRQSDAVRLLGSVHYLLNPEGTNTDYLQAKPSVLAGWWDAEDVAKGPDYEPTTSGKRSFKWTIPGPPTNEMTITTTCRATIRVYSGDSVIDDVSWVYRYELRKK